MPTCDIFCRVVDNFGDVGVCWRLAKCLAREHSFAVRLWIDDLDVFARFEPSIDRAHHGQSVEGIEIRRLREDLPESVLIPMADLVVQGFGSPLPAAYLRAMTRRSPHPVWVDLEYLSAEPWVDGFHGRASPQTRLGMVKHFFFPGFTAASGGVLREAGLEARRAAFQADAHGQALWWSRLGVAPAASGERRASLFCYPNRAAVTLLDALARDATTQWTVLVPEGMLEAELAMLFAGSAVDVGQAHQQGHLLVHRLPFLPQDEYDKLLWSCDLNFVRGEDSFVRAQWAGRPFIWHIYPQQGRTHLDKLDAFLDRYTQHWPVDAALALRAVWTDWNTASDAIAQSWGAWWQTRSSWESRIPLWPEALACQSDLATRLAQFASDLLKWRA
jgi:uncharacterized repeat protein (TIGR03837 family)